MSSAVSYIVTNLKASNNALVKRNIINAFKKFLSTPLNWKTINDLKAIKDTIESVKKYDTYIDVFEEKPAQTQPMPTPQPPAPTPTVTAPAATESEQSKIENFKKDYEEWKKDLEKDSEENSEKRQEPKLKAYSSMVGENNFLKDIEKLLDTSKIRLSVSVDTEIYDSGRKQVYLSDSDFLHLYDFAVILNGRYSIVYDKRYTGDLSDLNSIFDLKTKEDMENSFEKLSLEYKLSNISQAKAFAKYLDKLGMFYTDKPVAFKMANGFTDEQLETIGIMEHHRWLKERQQMGWTYGKPADKSERELTRMHPAMISDAEEITEERARQHYIKTLEDSDRVKDIEPMKCMFMLIKQYDGLRIYYLPDENK